MCEARHLLLHGGERTGDLRAWGALEKWNVYCQDASERRFEDAREQSVGIYGSAKPHCASNSGLVPRTTWDLRDSSVVEQSLAWSRTSPEAHASC